MGVHLQSSIVVEHAATEAIQLTVTATGKQGNTHYGGIRCFVSNKPLLLRSGAMAFRKE